MIKTIQIKDLNIEFAFLHRWQESEKKYSTKKFKEWKIGLWFKRTKLVGKRNFSAPEKWKLVNCYMFGIDFLIFKSWVSFDKGGKHFKED